MAHAILKEMPLENPFQDPLRFERRIPECAVVIFGANGDLTKRKLLPALYRLAYERRLAPGFAVLGISRTAMTDDQFRENMADSVAKFLEDSPFDKDVWSGFRPGPVLHGGRHCRSPDIFQPGRAAAADRRMPPHRGQRSVLPVHAAQPVRGRPRRALARPAWPKATAGGASSSKNRSVMIWPAPGS